MQEMVSERGSRKRKVEVDEELFQNGRIYQDWEDLHWTGESSNSLWEGNMVWGVERGYSAINLNSVPEVNPYHLDDF